jgi:hypothetical protein
MASIVIPRLVCRDPLGHVWTIATRIEETTAQERKDRWSSIQTKQ